MKNNFKTLKASLIMGILLISVSTAIVPSTSAAGFFVNLSSYLQAGFDASNFTSKPIVPRGELRSLTIYLKYGVNYGGLLKGLAKGLFSFYKDRQVNIKLELGDHSPWCTPTLFTNTITTKVGEAEETGFLQATLNLRVDLDAPAFGSGFVELTVSVPKVGMIAGYSNTFTLEFNPAYLPLIKSESQGGNSKRIGPMDTAVFPIEIENLGNAQTRVKLRVISSSVSQGWAAIVTDYIILDETRGSKGIAYLTVKPPKSFGYHDEQITISVELTPEYAQNPANQGSPQYVNVLVESRGFSVIGFEIIVIPLIIIVIIIFLVYYFMFRKKGKM